MGVPKGVHELHTSQLPLPGLVHKDGGETDVAVDQTTVCAQETYGFLRKNSFGWDCEMCTIATAAHVGADNISAYCENI